MAAQRPTRNSPSSGRSIWVRRLKQASTLGFIVLLGAVAAGLIIYIPIQREAMEDVGNIEHLLVVDETIPSVIVSADGKIIYSVETERRKPVDLKSLPKYVTYAILAAEDRRYFDHSGVDLRGLSRALTSTVRDGRASQGGSTIEMQLAKLLVNGSERSFRRKLKDIAVAQQITALKTKDEVLNLYANKVYYGEGAHGIQAAAETYFGKDAKDLTISEAAMLARCVRTPSRANPVKDLEGSIDRRNYVLEVMRQEGWITPAECEKAIAEKPRLNPNPPKGKGFIAPDAGYFVQHVLQRFAEDYPGVDLANGGYRIETTLDFQLQKEAVAAVSETLRRHADRKVNDAAIVLVDQDGKVLCEVGGRGYLDREYNVVTQGHRQPGSSFKPFLYAAALKEGAVRMGEFVSNEPISIPDNGKDWTPRNNGKERVGGSMSLTNAFAQSYNLPAVHTILKVGPLTVAAYAKDAFGFHSKIHPVPSLALGSSEVSPLEMAEGYSVFMLHGDRIRPYPITRIIGPDKEVLREYQPTRLKEVFDPAVCGEIDTLLEQVVQHGTGFAARDVPNARGKTGTTTDAKDAWFCGYSDGILGVGWVGNSRKLRGRWSALPMASSVFGGTVTTEMWAKIMTAARKRHAKPVVPTDSTALTVAARTKEVPAIREDEATPDEGPPATVPLPSTSPKGGDTPPTGETPPDDPASTPVDTPTPEVPPVREDPPRKRTPDPSDDEANTVEVEVCADTGLRASMYCPETVTRRFKKGDAPKRTCPLHHG